MPEDDPERERWIRKQWNPDDIALRVVQSAGHIIPVPWTAQLRAEWQTRWDQLRKLGGEVAYGLTGAVYASYPPAWETIAAGLQPDEMPERKPAILAGYQSPEEAKAELGLVPAESFQGPQAKLSETMPGGRPVDLVVALRIKRMVHEPDISDSQEAFLTAVQLSEDERFRRARRRLFNWEDNLFVDGWIPEEVEKALPGLEEEYRDAVRAQIKQTRRRWIATLLPKVGGWVIALSGHAKPANDGHLKTGQRE